MAQAFGISCAGEPLFFFYDCETTGLTVGYDVIIEVAAVLYTKDLQRGLAGPQEFASLCSCDKALSPKTKELTGLTDADLRGKPKVKDVLHRLFDWIKETVETASANGKTVYFPVLVAHSGRLLDFPMLFTAVQNNATTDPALQIKFDALNLHYGDTFSVFKHFVLVGKHKELKKLGLKDIHNTYFADSMDGHRAMKDAKTLRMIFSDAPPAAEFMATLRDYLQTKRGIEIMKAEAQKFKISGVPTPQAIELLQKGTTYEQYLRRRRM